CCRGCRRSPFSLSLDAILARPPRLSLFPYTTLFRSALVIDVESDHNTAETAKRVAKMFVNEVFQGRYVEAPAVTEFPNVSQLNEDRKSTRLNSSHVSISYAVFCLKKKKTFRYK